MKVLAHALPCGENSGGDSEGWETRDEVSISSLPTLCCTSSGE